MPIQPNSIRHTLLISFARQQVAVPPLPHVKRPECPGCFVRLNANDSSREKTFQKDLEPVHIHVSLRF